MSAEDLFDADDPALDAAAQAIKGEGRSPANGGSSRTPRPASTNDDAERSGATPVSQEEVASARRFGVKLAAALTKIVELIALINSVLVEIKAMRGEIAAHRTFVVASNREQLAAIRTMLDEVRSAQLRATGAFVPTEPRSDVMDALRPFREKLEAKDWTKRSAAAEGMLDTNDIEASEYDITVVLDHLFADEDEAKASELVSSIEREAYAWFVNPDNQALLNPAKKKEGQQAITAFIVGKVPAVQPLIEGTNAQVFNRAVGRAEKAAEKKGSV